mmetsp:Transcript_43359/g.92175  ORF Transcript_43359/g.92175 Transcript_43359/m.92175 type:complete len:382 (+) Transcript_43359:97-1242(+)|eukprot:CAMPEP_0172537352 /NCGR_PEP_ID=MMETSP1067-20121228/8971_1 /TAXON_ID=265564 ORGANISM="Thalassiosira punctigera, Strain Tpunct2005C2" /NCGR_SAMPLE_ID=MMETSP1067 /ASSEMBLY_ACC=CAM_ASM_000444 /LENGTH=381 /DNA_ID=CAMNT_0013322639 /DNA_START=23 /DNA_END=1168 /DNA_ORIENTATION=+
MSTGRKRPFAAIAGVAIGREGGDAVVDEVDDNHLKPDKLPGDDQGAALRTTSDRRHVHHHHVCFGKLENDVGEGSGGSVDGDQSGGRDSDSDNEEVPEITELRKALEYLVSERDVEKIYNGNKKETNESKASKSDTIAARNDTRGKEREDEQLCAIPNLINRILMEHYSNDQHGCAKILIQKRNSIDAESTDAKKSPPRKQREKMTQLLIAVILEFAEPHFARTARRRQQERSRNLTLQQRRRQARDEKKARGKQPQSSGDENALPRDDLASAFEFDERAASWATSCLKQLLRPPSASSFAQSSGAPNDWHASSTANKNCYDRSPLKDDGDRVIPELDALLAASGPHDGMEMERRTQSALMLGLQGRRLLQNMGMRMGGER